jgi:hypothetical protein
MQDREATSVAVILLTIVLQLFTRESCTVGADQEEFILLDCTHGDLCKIDVHSSAFGAIRGSIKDTLNSARDRMLKATEGQKQS